MRTYGRLPTTNEWVEISSDTVNGDDFVWLTTLIQCLKLVLSESPFFANYGIPAQQSVIQQVFPDYYVAQTQSQFAAYFASLIIAKLAAINPTYKVDVVTNVGTRLSEEIAV